MKNILKNFKIEVLFDVMSSEGVGRSSGRILTLNKISLNHLVYQGRSSCLPLWSILNDPTTNVSNKINRQKNNRKKIIRKDMCLGKYF